MHLTGNELELIPSTVAALAIIGSYFGVRSANRNSRTMAKDQYLQQNRTETYISLLKEIHYRGLLLVDRIEQQPGQKLSIQPPDPGSDEEVTFSAQLCAYSTSGIYKQWNVFFRLSAHLDGTIVRMKDSGVVLTSDNVMSFPELAIEIRKWRQARVDLINLVRSELKTGRRLARKFEFPDDTKYRFAEGRPEPSVPGPTRP